MKKGLKKRNRILVSNLCNYSAIYKINGYESLINMHDFRIYWDEVLLTMNRDDRFKQIQAAEKIKGSKKGTNRS